MRLRDVSPMKRLIFGSAAYLMVIVYAAWTLWGMPAIDAVFLLTGSVAGAAFIWDVVRRLNRRDDPRDPFYSNRPPDSPD
jgi:membrane protein implicated in regulation of membrane protease activity